MQWRDEGYILSTRPLGEKSLVASVLTLEQGRHLGLVRTSRTLSSVTVGTKVEVEWHARLHEHLGTFKIEPFQQAGFSLALYSNPWVLSSVNAACAMLEVSLPERHPYPYLYETFRTYLQKSTELASMGEAYQESSALIISEHVHFEVKLLAELGFGLDLSCCAATGSLEDLTYISPRSGRAVSTTAGAPYRDRLLALPKFLSLQKKWDAPVSLQNHWIELWQGLKLTRFFLEKFLLSSAQVKLPFARIRLEEQTMQKALKTHTLALDPEDDIQGPMNKRA